MKEKGFSSKVSTILYFVRTYLILMLSMSVIRGIFLFVNREASKGIPKGVILRGFIRGLTFDTAISCYILIGAGALYLIGMLLRSFKLDKIFAVILHLFLYFGVTLVSVICFMDVMYFKHFGFHMNVSVLDYADNFDEILMTTASEFHMIPIVIGLLLYIVLFSYLITKGFKLLAFKRESSLTKGIFSFVKETVFVLASVTLMVFGARGGFQQSTLNWGRAYYTKYPFANQIPLNAVFTIGKSYDTQRKESESGVHDVIPEDLDELTDNIRKYVGDDRDTFLSTKNPLLRKTVTGKPEKDYNVVLILVESLMADTVETLGGIEGMMPNYNKLTNEGMVFTNFFSNGNRSNKGILTTITGFPSQYGSSVLKKPAAQTPFISLPSILKERGYSTHFMYGADIEFDNKKGFLMTNGVDHITSRKDFPLSDATIKWGVPDDKVLSRTAEYIKTIKEPFFLEVFTLSNHAPYDVPEEFKIYDYKKHNGVAFTDYAIGQFIDEVKDEKWAQNTVFVFLGDHGENRGKKIKGEVDFHKFTNPLLIYTPGGQIKPSRVDTLGSQVDLLPTLMDILGGEYVHSSWGRSILKKDNKRRFAYFIENEFLGIMDDSSMYIEGLNIPGVLRERGDLDIIEDPKKVEMDKKAIDTYLDLTIYQEKTRTFGNSI